MAGSHGGEIPTAVGGVATLFLQCLIALLFLVLIALQYRLWAGENGLADSASLKQKIVEQKQRNVQLSENNRQLSAQVVALKSGLEEIESRAREDLGMVKPDETFYRVVERRVGAPAE